jgi:hypothetical protein
MEMSPMLYALHSTRVRHTKSALLSDSLRRLEQEAEPSTSPAYFHPSNLQRIKEGNLDPQSVDLNPSS